MQKARGDVYPLCVRRCTYTGDTRTRTVTEKRAGFVNLLPRNTRKTGRRLLMDKRGAVVQIRNLEEAGKDIRYQFWSVVVSILRAAEQTT